MKPNEKMTLDEVEQMWTLGPGQVHGPWAEQTATSILSLVAHMRTLIENWSLAQDREGFMVERITALERQLESDHVQMADAVEARLKMVEVKSHNHAIALAIMSERITNLESNVEGLVKELKESAEWHKTYDEIVMEVHRLRTENADLRKANANVQSVAAEYEERIKALQSDLDAARAETARKESRHSEQLAEGRAVNTALTEERDSLRKANANVQSVAAEYEERIKALHAENADLRKLVSGYEAITHQIPNPAKYIEWLKRGEWVSQPIETAPAKTVLLGWDGSRWISWFSTDNPKVYAEYMGIASWCHQPPPPGGAKDQQPKPVPTKLESTCILCQGTGFYFDSLGRESECQNCWSSKETPADRQPPKPKA